MDFSYGWGSFPGDASDIGLPQPLERDGCHLPAQTLLRVCGAIEAVALGDCVAQKSRARALASAMISSSVMGRSPG
jgi:hypothetical protein